jgi:methyl-CpG-binding domain protein 4
MWEFFQRWPTPEDASRADESEIQELIKNLGLSKRRAHILKRMSQEYLQDDWEDPIQLYGCGKYASDAWHIFCIGDWKEIEPSDHALNWYHDFLKQHYGWI